VTLGLVVAYWRVWFLLQSNNGFGVGELRLLRWLPSLEKLLFPQSYFVARIIILFIVERHNFLFVLLKVAPSGRKVASRECPLALVSSVLVVIALIWFRLLHKVRLVVDYLCSKFHTGVLHTTSSKAMITLSRICSRLLRNNFLPFFFFSLHFQPKILLKLLISFPKARLLRASNDCFLNILWFFGSWVVLVLIVQFKFILDELIVRLIYKLSRSYLRELVLGTTMHRCSS